MSYAFVFPGQGSQSVGMLNELASEHPIVEATFKEASDALGYDLWQVVSQDADGKLNQTDITQPAMLTAGIAVFRVLTDATNLAPSYYAGHSLGEYTALVASGALSLADGVKLVEKRGRFMQEAVPAGEGAMAAILGLEDDKIVEICEKSAGIVEAVNFNSPGQVVIAGAKQAVDNSLAAFEEAGAKRVVLLAVSVPSHCSLMVSASKKLAIELETIELSPSSAPVIHNATVSSYTKQTEIKEALVKQLFQPVQWVKTIEAMKENGVTQLFEVGPGKVLMGLNRRIDKKMGMQPVFDTKTLEKALALL